jgi:hypothetical protein
VQEIEQSSLDPVLPVCQQLEVLVSDKLRVNICFTRCRFQRAKVQFDSSPLTRTCSGL